MRLVTFTQSGSTRVGALNETGDIADLTAAGLPATMIGLLAGDGIDRARSAMAGAPVIPAAAAHIEAPVPRPGKVLAVGLNYRDHAEEANQPIPQRPIIFAKANTCIVGPGHPIYMPRHSRAVDWEAELCFIVGKTARYVKADEATAHIAGYTIGNDVSVRDWQFHAPTWMMGKSFDTHGTLGPAIVTPDELDPGNVSVRLYVNNDVKQDSNTSQLIFGVGEIMEYLSAGMTLEPGDVVYTGTPAGVGGTRQPPQFLKPGDTVRIEIQDLGTLENPVTEYPG